jgi:hypothetical protein
MQDLTRTGGSVLIGREDEVARVEAVLDHLRSSMGEALVISGAAGNAASAGDSDKRGVSSWMSE